MLVSAIAAGVLAGLLLRGDLRRLGSVRIELPVALFAAVALRLLAPVAPFAPLPLYVTSLALIVLVGLANRRLPGAPLIAVGAALNLAVVAANGGMPVDLAAAAAVGSAGPHDPLHLPLEPGSRVAGLADVIPVAVGPVRSVYSVGDFLDAAGGFWLTFRVIRP